jgi:hypothetical protein
MLPGRLSRKAELLESLVVKGVSLHNQKSEKGSGTACNFGIPKIPKCPAGL